MVENRGGEPLDPAPGYDCHMSKSVAIDLQTVTPQEAYESTQVLLGALFIFYVYLCSAFYLWVFREI
jgi:hypothetical protein